MRRLLFLGSVAALGPLSTDSYLAAFPVMRTELGTTSAMVQATLTAFLIGAAIGPVVMGPLSDLIGRRVPFVGSLAALAVTSWLAAAAPGIEALIVIRLFQGFFGMSSSILSQAVLRDMTPDGDLMRSLSRMRMVSLSAPIVAPGLGVVLLQWTGWRGIFVLTGAVAATLAVLASRLPQALYRGPAADTRRVFRQSMASYRFLFGDQRVVLGNIAAASSFSALMLYISNGSLVFRDTFGVQPSEFGVIFTTNAVCMLIGSQLAPTLVARAGSTRVYLGAGLLAAFGMTGMLSAGIVGVQARGVFFTGLALSVFAFGIALILPTKELMEIHPERAGAGAALLRSGNMLTAAAAAFALAHFATETVVPMALGMLLLEAIAMASWIRRMRLQGSTVTN